MKKIILRILVVLVILILMAALAIHFFLDGAVKRGVEKYGSSLAKVEVKLQSAAVSLLSGSGKLKGLVVGNPEGYKSASAISLGTGALSLEPRTIFANKVVIRTFSMEAPEVTFETDLKSNNLRKILDNLEGSTAGDENQTPKQKESKEGKHLEVDDFVIRGGKIHIALSKVIASQSVTEDLPEIHLTELGKEGNGITAAELAKKVISAIEKEAVKLAADAASGALQGKTDLTKNLGLSSTGSVSGAAKG